MMIREVAMGHMGYVPALSRETWLYAPNSVGGVSVRFQYRNDSDKTVKYVTFTVVPYNAVKDVQKCTTRGKSEVHLRVTGPITAGLSGNCTFENVWYNSTISTIELTKIKIDYMDGSTETLKGGEIQYEEIPRNPPSAGRTGGCYVATAVYGSYDCPQVWTLRRFRDNMLAGSWYGRAFIRTYYAVSPTLVRWFGETKWFQKLWRGPLDRLVDRLQSEGVENTPYNDRPW